MTTFCSMFLVTTQCECLQFTCTYIVLRFVKVANLAPDSASFLYTFQLQLSLNQWQSRFQRRNTTKRCMNLILEILMKWHLKKETLFW